MTEGVNDIVTGEGQDTVTWKGLNLGYSDLGVVKPRIQ